MNRFTVYLSETEMLHYRPSNDIGRWEVIRFIRDQKTDDWTQSGTWSIDSFEFIREFIDYMNTFRTK